MNFLKNTVVYQTGKKHAGNPELALSHYHRISLEFMGSMSSHHKTWILYKVFLGGAIYTALEVSY